MGNIIYVTSFLDDRLDNNRKKVIIKGEVVILKEENFMSYNERIQYEENTTLVVGISKTSESNPITALYENVILVLIVERTSGKIINAEINSVCKITNDFVNSILISRNLYEETEFLCEQITNRYLGASKKTLINCIKDAKNKLLTSK